MPNPYTLDTNAKLNILYGPSRTDTFSPLTPEQQTYYSAMLIKRTYPRLPFWDDAQKVTVPARSGGFQTGAIQFRKFNALAVDTTPLLEGIPPAPKQLSVSVVSAQLQQYGDWIRMTDLLLDTSTDDIMMEAMDLLAENAGVKLTRVVLASLIPTTGLNPAAPDDAGFTGTTAINVSGVTQVIYGGAATSAATLVAGSVIDSSAIRKAVRLLSNANVPRFPDGFYHGFLTPYQYHDIQLDSLWQDISRYNGGSADGKNSLVTGFVGDIHGVRFQVSSEMPVFTPGQRGDAGTSNDHNAIVYGPDAYGVLDLKTQMVKNIDSETGRGMNVYMLPREATKDDPLNQWTGVGWKAAFASKVIDYTRMVRIRTSASA